MIELFSSEWPIYISDIGDVSQCKDICPHVLSPLRGKAPAAASLRVGDRRNTDDLQVTHILMLILNNTDTTSNSFTRNKEAFRESKPHIAMYLLIMSFIIKKEKYSISRVQIQQLVAC